MTPAGIILHQGADVDLGLEQITADAGDAPGQAEDHVGRDHGLNAAQHTLHKGLEIKQLAADELN